MKGRLYEYTNEESDIEHRKSGVCRLDVPEKLRFGHLRIRKYNLFYTLEHETMIRK